MGSFHEQRAYFAEYHDEEKKVSILPEPLQVLPYSMSILALRSNACQSQTHAYFTRVSKFSIVYNARAYPSVSLLNEYPNISFKTLPEPNTSAFY
jgi:hypothetical protein